MSQGRHDAAGYLGWFLFGAALGAAVTLLTTSRAGQEARERLADRSGDIARWAGAWADEAHHQAGGWIDRSRELFEEQTQRLTTAIEAGKEAMREEMRRWAPRP
jgi:gas vesicle protein